MTRIPCFDSPDPSTRKIMYWYCKDTGKCYDSALAGSTVYDSPDKSRPCPDNFKSANGGKVCIREHSNTPLLDSLQASTEFPRPEIPISKNKTRLNREKSLTELFGGPL